jgi:hypothetical protein
MLTCPSRDDGAMMGTHRMLACPSHAEGAMVVGAHRMLTVAAHAALPAHTPPSDENLLTSITPVHTHWCKAMPGWITTGAVAVNSQSFTPETYACSVCTEFTVATVRGSGRPRGMSLVTRLLASSGAKAWEPMASSSVHFCRKTRTAHYQAMQLTLTQQNPWSNARTKTRNVHLHQPSIHCIGGWSGRSQLFLPQ